MNKNSVIDNQPRLILMCGLPGSGKTTLARELSVDIPAVRLCTDDWHSALKVDESNEKFHDLLEQQLWIHGRELLKLGQIVIFEKGLWRKSERDQKRREAKELGVDIELHYFDVPVSVLVERLELRNNIKSSSAFYVTKDQIQEYATKYFQPPSDKELKLFAKTIIHR